MKKLGNFMSILTFLLPTAMFYLIPITTVILLLQNETDDGKKFSVTKITFSLEQGDKIN
jgi:hypothetical protein